MKEVRGVCIFILVLSVNLSGCGGDKQTSSETNLLADIDFFDEGVKNCVEQGIQEKGWVFIEDVKQLYCEKFAKQQVVDLELGIWDGRDLAQFVYLEELIIKGNYYSSLDLTALSRLKKLDVSLSFVESLDISKNTALEYVNVSSTPLSHLDASLLPNLKELVATPLTIDGSDFYQDEVISFIDELLLEAGLPMDMGDSIRTVSRDRIENASFEVEVHTDAVFDALLARNSTELRIGYPANLVELRGRVNVSVIEGAKTLKRFVGEIHGDQTIDLSEHGDLEYLTFKSDVVNELHVPEGLNSLSVIAPLEIIRAPENAQLSMLSLDSGQPDYLYYSMDDLDVFFLSSVKWFEFSRYRAGRRTLFNNMNGLESLVLKDIFVDIGIEIPNNLKTLTFENILYDFSFNSGLNLKTLNIIQSHPQLCGLQSNYLEYLENLYIRGCQSDTLHLRAVPSLRNLTLNDSAVQTLDISVTPKLDAMTLNSTALTELDLSPFLNQNIRRSLLQISNSRFSEEKLSIIQNEASTLFDRVILR